MKDNISPIMREIKPMATAHFKRQTVVEIYNNKGQCISYVVYPRGFVFAFMFKTVKFHLERGNEICFYVPNSFSGCFPAFTISYDPEQKHIFGLDNLRSNILEGIYL